MTEETLRTQSTRHDPHLPPPRRIILDAPSWIPTEKFPRRVIIGSLVAFVLIVVAGTALPFSFGWIDQGDLEAFGYPGIFLANFFGTATVFIPVPGLTAAGQALIVEGPRSLNLNPLGVIVFGASGMTLAEATAYATGAIGRGVAEERPMPLAGRLGGLFRRAARWIDWLMARYGFATLLVLSAVPNIFFEFAGITAGATRMNFWRFLLAVGIGKTIRVILLVVIGDALLDLFKTDV
ncbi:MAG TPA: VTT domain-containing protein [Dehalococcoidia bacterium]|nr:VTT domain-containing protein [Dehalococcoidia bacterium]